MNENIFADEWRDCLRAHYMHVVRNSDHVTEPTLRVVMHDAGFSESELAELRVRATMHVADVGADFVPDLDVLQGTASAEGDAAPAAEAQTEAVYFVSVPVETDYPLPDETPESVAESEAPIEEQPQAEPESVETSEDEAPDVPQQLTLF